MGDPLAHRSADKVPPQVPPPPPSDNKHPSARPIIGTRAIVITRKSRVR